MKSDLPDTQDAALDRLLNELSLEPDGPHGMHHKAPQGLRERILLATQDATTATESAVESEHHNALDNISEPHTSGFTEPAAAHWFPSPWRAIAASAAPLLLGILLGSNTTAKEFYSTNVDSQDYPDNDQLLVIASIDQDFTASLDIELPQDWSQESEPARETSPIPGATTP